jgi:hypothetical protein
MIYDVGQKVIINSKNGWGGNFHKCKGIITSLEYDNMFRVEVEPEEVPALTQGHSYMGSHSSLCNPSNVLRVV